MAALLLLEALRVTAQGLYQHGQQVFVGSVAPFHAVLAVIFLAVTLAAVHWALGRRPGIAGSMPAVLPTSGLQPLELPLAILGSIYAFTPFAGGTLDGLVEVLTPGTSGWLLFACLGVLLTVPLSSLFFYWRRRRWWTGPERGRWLAMQALTTAAILGIVFLENRGYALFPHLLVGGAVTWIVLVALLGDGWTEIRAWRSSPAGALSVLTEHQDVADALEDLEARRREDPDGYYALAGLRYRSLCYFFGPYVPLRILGAPTTHSRLVEA